MKNQIRSTHELSDQFTESFKELLDIPKPKFLSPFTSMEQSQEADSDLSKKYSLGEIVIYPETLQHLVNLQKDIRSRYTLSGDFLTAKEKAKLAALKLIS